MEKMSRRSAIRAAAAVAVTVGTAVLGGTAAGDETRAPRLWTLEGELKVHPKFIYRYYLVLLDGQKCALYGSAHGRESDQLARLQLPVRVRVRGVLGTAHHPGGTKENPSSIPEGWIMYMDVPEVKVLNFLPPRQPNPGQHLTTAACRLSEVHSSLCRRGRDGEADPSGISIRR